jgi:hypothetical protein
MTPLVSGRSVSRITRNASIGVPTPRHSRTCSRGRARNTLPGSSFLQITSGFATLLFRRSLSNRWKPWAWSFPNQPWTWPKFAGNIIKPRSRTQHRSKRREALQLPTNSVLRPGAVCARGRGRHLALAWSPVRTCPDLQRLSLPVLLR